MEGEQKKLSCYKCHGPLALDSFATISRQEECPHCYTDMRCCRMCSFYDPSSYNECREPMANRILDKEKANFCDFFKLGGSQDGGNNRQGLINAANSIFKN